MKTMGFLISTKENEKRRALLPEHLVSIKNKESLYFESGYGDLLGHCDEEYIAKGVNVVSKEEAMNQDICDPKIGDADYLELCIRSNGFRWIHAVQNKDITDKLIQRRLTAIAWEDMFKKRHVFGETTNWPAKQRFCMRSPCMVKCHTNVK